MKRCSRSVTTGRRMQHPEEGTIHAWLDGELSVAEVAALESHVGECADCAAKLAEARGLIAASSRIVSALDSVPGDVIPEPLSLPEKSAVMRSEVKLSAANPRAAKSHRWYSSAQFRAAAAVILVAGASLLVARGRDETSMQRAVRAPSSSEIAGPVAAPESDMSRAADASVSAPAEMSQRKASSETALRKSAATAAAPAPPPRVTSITSGKDESFRERRVGVAGSSTQSRRILGMSDSAGVRQVSPQIGNVVVTGVAEATAVAPVLQSMRADTVMGSIRTTYAVSPGVEVTLVESPVRNFSAKVASPQSSAAQSAPAPVASSTRIPSLINSITWLQRSTGRMATLSGPLSKEELEAIRQKLPVSSR